MNALTHRAGNAAGGAPNVAAVPEGIARDGDRFTRRGACPALSAPMQTGDGLLVRLNPVAGGISPNALIGLCKAALRHGNGVVEVTARGSLQIRGLTPVSSSLLPEEIDALGIAVRIGVPVQTGALAGLDPDEIADPISLAERIRDAIERTGLSSRLGPKVSVVVDGGGRSGMENVAADVRLTVVRDGARRLWQVAIAGHAGTAKMLGAGESDYAASETALSILSAIAAIGHDARARDLPQNKLRRFSKGLQSFAPPSGLPAISPLEGEMAGRPEGGVREQKLTKPLISLGIFAITNSRHALGVALPFGHARAENLIALADKAEALGVAEFRLAPKRTILALCPSRESARSLQDHAETLGFVVSPIDPRTGISACPGAPVCASGHIAAREMASEIANEYSGLLDGSFHLHISGCAKGCAHPGEASLTLVGGETGAGLVVNGTARDVPLAYTARDGARRALENIAGLVRSEGLEGEDSAAALARLGPARIAEVFEKK